MFKQFWTLFYICVLVNISFLGYVWMIRALYEYLEEISYLSVRNDTISVFIK